MSVQNRNQTVEWCRQPQSHITLDNRLLQFDPPVRGIYGIFIEDKGQEKNSHEPNGPGRCRLR